MAASDARQDELESTRLAEATAEDARARELLASQVREAEAMARQEEEVAAEQAARTLAALEAAEEEEKTEAALARLGDERDGATSPRVPLLPTARRRTAHAHPLTPHLSRPPRAHPGLEMPPEALVMNAGPLGLVRSLRRQRKAISETDEIDAEPVAPGAFPDGSPQRGGKLRVARACQEARAVTDRVDSMLRRATATDE